jgi:hypothetical protein
MLDRTFFILVVIIIIAACAKISTPSGGPKDRTPPVVVKTVPLYAARNFHGNKIEIIFDEYVVLDNINEKFMVSPPGEKELRLNLTISLKTVQPIPSIFKMRSKI